MLFQFSPQLFLELTHFNLSCNQGCIFFPLLFIIGTVLLVFGKVEEYCEHRPVHILYFKAFLGNL